MVKKTESKNFAEILLEAIDAALEAVGEKSKIAIYSFIEENCNIQKQEIPYRLEDFKGALEKIFGGCTRWLEILILENLNSEVSSVNQRDLHAVDCELTFQERVGLVRENINSKVIEA